MNKIIAGDCLEILKTLEPESIDCVITSPPYWGLRDYGVAGQFGLEPDFLLYVNNLCNIFDQVKRVLKPDGTVWVNLGDTYGGRVGGAQGKNGQFAGRQVTTARIKHQRPAAKSLLQIPSRFALEMADRGWILRNEIIWHKPNCMPESIRDRFTVDHEKIFLFVKAKTYYFDQEATLEPVSPNTHARLSQKVQDQVGSARAHGGKKANGNMKAVGRKFDPSAGNKNNPSFDNAMAIMPEKRNKRSVWSVSTKPFKGAHFAVYPEQLIVPMILAGCPMGGVVLDPFFGSGITGVVAKKLGRQYIGIELNPEYIKIAEKRLAQEQLL